MNMYKIERYGAYYAIIVAPYDYLTSQKEISRLEKEGFSRKEKEAVDIFLDKLYEEIFIRTDEVEKLKTLREIIKKTDVKDMFPQRIADASNL